MEREEVNALQPGDRLVLNSSQGEFYQGDLMIFQRKCTETGSCIRVDSLRTGRELIHIARTRVNREGEQLSEVVAATSELKLERDAVIRVTHAHHELPLDGKLLRVTRPHAQPERMYATYIQSHPRYGHKEVYFDKKYVEVLA